MKNVITILAMAAIVLCVGVAAAAQNDVCKGSDALANAAWDNGWCGDKAPASKWAEFEDTLAVPYEESTVITPDDAGFEDPDAELATESSMADAALLSDWGTCDTLGDGTANNPYRIFCTNTGSVLSWYRVGVYWDTANYSRLHACRSTDGGATWTLTGQADMEFAGNPITELHVEGSGGSEYIGIQKDDTSGTTDCDFADFTNQFISIVVRGNGGTDAVFGSQYNDTFLEGEYVMGYEGNDDIYLTIASYPAGLSYYYAHGGPGNDRIYGTNLFPWVDAIVGGEGDDTIYGYAGGDDLYGYTGTDTIFGGDDQDVLHGGDGMDNLYGGNARDYMYGGNDNDYLNGIATETAGAYDFIYGENGYDTLSDNYAGVCNGGNPSTLPGDGCTCPFPAEVNCEY